MSLVSNLFKFILVCVVAVLGCAWPSNSPVLLGTAALAKWPEKSNATVGERE